MEVQIPKDQLLAAIGDDLKGIKEAQGAITDLTSRSKAAFDQISVDMHALSERVAGFKAAEPSLSIPGAAEIESILDALASKAKAMGVTPGAIVAAATKKCSRSTKLEKACADFIPPGGALLSVLFEGGKGSGKTYQLNRWLMATYEKENVFRTDCDNTLRTPDMRGHPCPEGDGTPALGWLDKTASSVFRHINKHRRPTAWMLDELLALKEDTMNSFKSMLSPTDYDTGDGMESHYRLETGRPIGDPGHKTSEVLYAPTRLLAIAGTTNRGSRYFVNEMDEAMESRWRMVEINCTETDIAKIFKIKINEHMARFSLTWNGDEIDLMCHFAKRFFHYAKKAAIKNELKTYPSNREFANLLVGCVDEPQKLLMAFDSRSTNHLYDGSRYCSKDAFGSVIKQHQTNLKNCLDAVMDDLKSKMTADKMEQSIQDRWGSALKHVM